MILYDVQDCHCMLCMTVMIVIYMIIHGHQSINTSQWQTSRKTNGTNACATQSHSIVFAGT